jgi:hypothetical protein
MTLQAIIRVNFGAYNLSVHLNNFRQNPQPFSVSLAMACHSSQAAYRVGTPTSSPWLVAWRRESSQGDCRGGDFLLMLVPLVYLDDPAERAARRVSSSRRNSASNRGLQKPGNTNSRERRLFQLGRRAGTGHEIII